MNYYRHATLKHNPTKLDLIYGNEQDRENLAVIKGKALEIINEAIDALNRLRSSKPPN